MYKPVLAITIGDPAGIGPEIALKALADATLSERCRPVLIGDIPVLERALRFDNMPGLSLRPVTNTKDARYEPGVIDVLETGAVTDADSVPLSAASAAGGDAAFQYVLKAIELAQTGEADATVTAPINKEAINLAGHHFAGHTEIYAHCTGVKQGVMLLAYGDLRVAHVSTHVSLREACDRVRYGRVLEVIRTAHRACQTFGIENPRVCVAGLNPHSGEGGLFGTEEIEEIIPAIKTAREEGLTVDGPLPPDTVFPKAKGGWYDIVVAMYHDQGHIPLKFDGFVYDRQAGDWLTIDGVNITLGLPIIRTSVDHGTAFDQAGTGRAGEQSMKSAVEYAIRLHRFQSTISGTADGSYS